uniref:Cyclic nucleotide-binding domain-containing protein n=1 Tax=Ditylenchus dipsaci TaxID=166011 RepID=A0A915DIL4_9BILA
MFSTREPANPPIFASANTQVQRRQLRKRPFVAQAQLQIEAKLSASLCLRVKSNVFSQNATNYAQCLSKKPKVLPRLLLLSKRVLGQKLAYRNAAEGCVASQRCTHQTSSHPPQESVRAKKMAVSAEPAKLDAHKTTLQHHAKTADAVQKNDFLRQLAKEQVIELVECMFEMRARAGQWRRPSLRVVSPGVVMGELAILYNCTRTASVQAMTDVLLWVLDRSAFQMITMRLGMERHAQLMNFLHKGGEKGDTFFVINNGQVRVTQSIEGEQEPREIRILKQGDFFGEKALLGEEVRTANVIAMSPGVEVLTLDRESFLKLIGDLEALKRDYGDLQRRATLSSRSLNEPPSPTKIAQENEYSGVQLRQLKRIATLGVGGFGRVELVCINGDKSKTFALKALKKNTS